MESNIVDISNLPNKPGVYKFKNKIGEIIYVGASKNLQKRVKSYFIKNKSNSRLTKLVINIVYIEFEIIKSANLAFLRERELITLHKPKFNVRWLDDKQYPYLVITTSEKYPRLVIARSKKLNGNLYFEKQTHVKPLRKSLKQIRKIFPICDCYKTVTPKKYKRPCLNYDLKLCPAPCAERISENNYKDNVNNLISFLNGDSKKLIDKWNKQMAVASDHLEFEKASTYKNQIETLRNLSLESRNEIYEFIDVIGYNLLNKNLSLVILSIKDGKLFQKYEYYLKEEILLNIDEILLSGLKVHYLQNKIYPSLILFPKPVHDLDFFFEWLNEETKENIKFQIMSNITKNKWVTQANLESKSALKRNFMVKIDISDNYGIIDEDLQNILGINHSVSMIECIDISTFQGSNTVGSIVSFKNGVPNKSHYRKYKLKNINKPNDVGSMNEVLTRHFKRKKIDKLEPPNLLLVDGGKSQLSAVDKVFKELKLEIPYIGITKKEEELIIPNLEDSIKLQKDSRTLQLLVSIRNEAHRFAITYHKKLRKKSILSNELESIPGIGMKKRLALLIHFKTIENVKKASLKELLEVKKINKLNAKKIILHFNP